MNDGRPVYIHYGNTEFDPTKGFPIQNRPFWVKPRGGLWASRVDASFGWKQWCKEEDYMDCKEENSFRFVLHQMACVHRIMTLRGLYSLPKQKEELPSLTRYLTTEYCIDFEQCVKDGIDAIELCYYGKEFNESPSYSVSKPSLYSALYGWDCDSIVILNPKVIRVVK